MVDYTVVAVIILGLVTFYFVAQVLIQFFVAPARPVPVAAGAKRDKLRPAHPPRDFTRAQLTRFDGATETTPIYVAINGKVFDVSSKRETYAKTAGYGIFAGQDASWALATMEMDPKKWNMDGHLPDLSDSARDSLYQWEAYFTERYPTVGYLTDGFNPMTTFQATGRPAAVVEGDKTED